MNFKNMLTSRQKGATDILWEIGIVVLLLCITVFSKVYHPDKFLLITFVSFVVLVVPRIVYGYRYDCYGWIYNRIHGKKKEEYS